MVEFKFSEKFVEIHGFINYQFISNESMSTLLKEMNTALKMPIENVDEETKGVLFTYLSNVEEAGFNSDFFNVGFGTGVFVTALDASSGNPAVTDLIGTCFESIVDNSDTPQETKYFSSFKVYYKDMKKVLDAVDFIFSYSDSSLEGIESLREEINNAAYKCDFLSLGYFIGALSFYLQINYKDLYQRLRIEIRKAFNLK